MDVLSAIMELSLTEALGLYGAGLSTALAVSAAVRKFKDRPRLSISTHVGVGLESIGPDGIAHPRLNDLVYVKAVNTGTQSIVVEKVGLMLDTRGVTFHPMSVPQLPKRLEPGELVEAAVCPLGAPWEQVVCAAAWDSLGKAWRTPARGLENVKQVWRAARR